MAHSQLSHGPAEPVSPLSLCPSSHPRSAATDPRQQFPPAQSHRHIPISQYLQFLSAREEEKNLHFTWIPAETPSTKQFIQGLQETWDAALGHPSLPTTK